MKEWMTEYMVDLLGDIHFVSMENLLLTHTSKQHYIVHFALLQFCLEMGAVVTKVHRVVTFAQSDFFKPYISFNSKQRQARLLQRLFQVKE